jgi:ankyrin repeat protein
VSLAKFFNACSTGKHEAVASFLASGVDPEQRDSNHLTGLIWAGRKGHVGVARVLLDYGAALETGDIRQRTALFHAATYQRYEFVQFLAVRGANVSPIDTHGWTPLDFSHVSRHLKMVKLLKELGAVAAHHKV